MYNRSHDPNHAIFRGVFVICRLNLDVAYEYLCTKSYNSIFSHSRDMLGSPKNSISCITLPCHFQEWFVIHGQRLATIKRPTKYEVFVSTVAVHNIPFAFSSNQIVGIQTIVTPVLWEM